MIDAKNVEELVSRKTELLAETNVYIAIGDFISSNMDRCKNERKYSEWQAWIDALNDVNMKLKKINDEMEDIAEQLDKMVKKIEV